MGPPARLEYQANAYQWGLSMGTNLKETGGFTPVIDTIVLDTSFITAAVYGKVWRYCQMRTGTCMASLQRMADELGMSRRTVMRHLKILVEKGYLEDTTPARRNRPHVYRDIGMTLSHTSTDKVGQSDLPGGSESHRRWVRESLEDTSKIQQDIDDDGRAETLAILCNFGVGITVAREIVGKHNSATIESWMTAAKSQPNLKNRAGYVIKGLRSGKSAIAPKLKEKVTPGWQRGKYDPSIPIEIDNGGS